VDADTLARARRGEPAARRAIVEALAPEVVAITGDANAAEAVLAAVVADLPRYQLGVERLEAWVRTRAEKARDRRLGAGVGAVDRGEPGSPTPTPTALNEMIDRVLARPVVEEAPRPKLRLGVAAAVVAAAAIAAIVIAWVRTPQVTGPPTGRVEATARAQVRMAAGVAVVEPGAAIAWKGGAIEQRAGTVYYRIERAATITTPHGAIRTAHASGRVAVAATTTMDTIDEGDAVVGAAAVTAGGGAALP
jgi:hypothetical protein